MLVHKRAIVAANNNMQKKANLANNAKRVAENYIYNNPVRNANTERRLVANHAAKYSNYEKSEQKLRELLGKIYPGINAENIDIRPLKGGLSRNIVIKHLGPNVKAGLGKIARALGLNSQKKRAAANYNEFISAYNNKTKQWNVKKLAPKAPSPKRARTGPSPKRSPTRILTPANFARQAEESFVRWHGPLAPPTNSPKTWRRNANSKVSLIKL
jgi:hypothetical protein